MLKDLIDASKTLGDVLNELERDVISGLPAMDGVKRRQAMTVIERIRSDKPVLSDKLGMLIREVQALYSQVPVK
jgi:hypothetical protein